MSLKEHLLNHPYPSCIHFSEKGKIIYMKTPKTASTSILNFLKNNFPDIYYRPPRNEYVLGSDIQDQKDSILKNRVFDWLNTVSEKQLREYYIFSSVRNPWDRLVSFCYYYGISVRDYLLNTEKYDFYSPEHLAGHSTPQHFYTHLSTGQKFVDRIIRLEKIEEDFKYLVSDILPDCKTQPIIEHKNKSKRDNNYINYFDKNLIDLVYNKYGKDIMYYNYSFGETY